MVFAVGAASARKHGVITGATDGFNQIFRTGATGVEDNTGAMCHEIDAR